MADNSILGIAQNGMQTGLLGIKKNAASLASKEAMESKGTPVSDLVEMKANQYQVLLSGKVVQTADTLLGSLLDETV